MKVQFPPYAVTVWGALLIAFHLIVSPADIRTVAGDQCALIAFTVFVARVGVGVLMGLLRQPGRDVGRLGRGIIETRIEDAQRVDPAMIGNQHRRAGVEFFKAAEQGGRGRIGQIAGEIRFGQDDAVGDRDLLL